MPRIQLNYTHLQPNRFRERFPRLWRNGKLALIGGVILAVSYFATVKAKEEYRRRRLRSLAREMITEPWPPRPLIVARSRSSDSTNIAAPHLVPCGWANIAAEGYLPPAWLELSQEHPALRRVPYQPNGFGSKSFKVVMLLLGTVAVDSFVAPDGTQVIRVVDVAVMNLGQMSEFRFVVTELAVEGGSVVVWKELNLPSPRIIIDAEMEWSVIVDGQSIIVKVAGKDYLLLRNTGGAAEFAVTSPADDGETPLNLGEVTRRQFERKRRTTTPGG